jgi:outer membrane biosynthesis protein TonB
VVQRQIASPDAPVPPDKREPIDWIPIDNQTLSGLSGSVAFVLVVSPNGNVEQEPVVVESTNSKLEQIARQTIRGYYNKFQPLDGGKYRLVRIQYKAP